MKSGPGDIYRTALNLTVLVAGLGYFVDTFDFFLYNSMRVVSLTELGLTGDALTRTGILILNCQILGALIGSFFWGSLGDKSGRKKGLLGSILVYSIGMVATGLVHDTVSYGIVRFITGFGVAGEVGLGATLVAETIAAARRTYALTFFTVLGLLGIVAAGMSLEFVSWRMSCFIGGGIGLLLLTLRGLLFESGLFVETAQAGARRGSLHDLIGNSGNFRKYLLCIPLLGSNFFVTGILITLSPEIGKSCGVTGAIKANVALAVYFSAAVVGDFLAAWLSGVFKSRRLVAGLFIAGTCLIAMVFVQKLNLSAIQFYALCMTLGLFNLWAISATILVEQFPTQLRATASTSNLNFSRAMVVLMNLALLSLKPVLGLTNGLMTIGGVIFVLALFCVWRLPESYNRSLGSLEPIV